MTAEFKLSVKGWSSYPLQFYFTRTCWVSVLVSSLKFIHRLWRWWMVVGALWAFSFRNSCPLKMNWFMGFGRLPIGKLVFQVLHYLFIEKYLLICGFRSLNTCFHLDSNTKKIIIYFFFFSWPLFYIVSFCWLCWYINDWLTIVAIILI